MIPLDDCGERAEAGPKAVRLARARAAGFPVLDGEVLLPDEPIDRAALAEALRRLGAPFIVRSSSSAEDGARASGAGVFVSVVGAADLDTVADAIKSVRASATSQSATAYAPRSPMAVLIQPMVAADAMIVAMSEPGGFVVEERAATAAEWTTPLVRHVGEGDLLGALLARLTTFAGGPIVAELARAGLKFTLLQVRPRPDGAIVSPLDGAIFAVAGNWRRDAHNPDPLSTAQADLVARVERLGVGPRQRVIGGYLFAESGTGARGETPWPDCDLAARFDHQLAPALRAALRTSNNGSLDAALTTYDLVYRRYITELAPSRRQARHALDTLLQAELGESLDAHGMLLDGAGGAASEREVLLWSLRDATGEAWARYVATFGAWSCGWDVALPTDGESPARVLALAEALRRGARPEERRRQAVARAIEHAAALAIRLSPSARARWPEVLSQARDAVRVGEDDDTFYFAAQQIVRAALLRRGQTLVAEGRLAHAADVFDLPLSLPEGALGAHVEAARDLAKRALATWPPHAIDDGIPRRPVERGVLYGRATAGRAHGRVHHLRAATALIPDDAVLFVDALVPSLGPLLANIRALVTAEGGVASHGALLARERGLVAVIGVGPFDARAIPDGTPVLVDGDAGSVHLLRV